MNFGDIITAGSLTMLLIDGIKWLVRKIKKNPEFVFPTAFYALVTPLLNAVMPFALVLLGLVSNDPILNMTWVEVLRYIVQIFLASLFTFLGYNTAIKPLKDRAKLAG